MAQAMESKAPIVQAGFSQQGLVLPMVEVVVVHRLAVRIREYEIMILPAGLSKALFVLAQLMSPKCNNRRVVEGYGPAAGFVLRRSEA